MLAEYGRRVAETFKFLGFVHICSKTKEGWFLLKRQTDGKRMRAKLGPSERHYRTGLLPRVASASSASWALLHR